MGADSLSPSADDLQAGSNFGPRFPLLPHFSRLRTTAGRQLPRFLTDMAVRSARLPRLLTLFQLASNAQSLPLLRTPRLAPFPEGATMNDRDRAGESPPPTERRASHRQQVQRAAVVRPGGLSAAFYGNGWIEDVSGGGLRLRLDYPLVPGTVVTVDLYNPHLRDDLRVRVVYIIAQADGSWRAGCVFEPSTPENRGFVGQDATPAGASADLRLEQPARDGQGSEPTPSLPRPATGPRCLTAHL
jgi:PilZ domain